MTVPFLHFGHLTSSGITDVLVLETIDALGFRTFFNLLEALDFFESAIPAKEICALVFYS